MLAIVLRFNLLTIFLLQNPNATLALALFPPKGGMMWAWPASSQTKRICPEMDRFFLFNGVVIVHNFCYMFLCIMYNMKLNDIFNKFIKQKARLNSLILIHFFVQFAQDKSFSFV